MRQPGLLALVAYDGLCTFEYSIAVEVFARVRPTLGVPWYRTIVVTPDRGELRGIGGVRVEADAPLTALARVRTIVIPGWRAPQDPPPQALLNALLAAHRRGARLLSICSGAFVIAACGLLEGRRATTHWLYAADFRAMFPRVEFVDDVLYVDEGQIITSAGSAAGVDACLHLVRRDYGARVANIVARRMVTAPHREGGQAQYVETPVAARAGPTIGEVLDWARERMDRPITVSELARRTAMSERTFLRHFQAALGMPPSTWLQRTRVARARELLESTSLPHAAIAEQCGFDSAETFRVAFRRNVGVAPGAYRLRFSALEAARVEPPRPQQSRASPKRQSSDSHRGPASRP